jgi:hypothetical protein
MGFDGILSVVAIVLALYMLAARRRTAENPAALALLGAKLDNVRSRNLGVANAASSASARASSRLGNKCP